MLSDIYIFQGRGVHNMVLLTNLSEVQHLTSELNHAIKWCERMGKSCSYI